MANDTIETTTQTLQTSDNYSSNVREFGYAVGTGIFLVILFAVLLLALFNWVRTTVNTKLEKVLKYQETFKEGLNEVVTTNKTALNIILKHRLNGDKNE